MFTGIIEEIGVIQKKSDHALTVQASATLSDLSVSQSIALNGACLTVVDVTTGGFTIELSEETLIKTNLGSLIAGQEVNLERSLSFGGRMGGHLVQGHVDGVCTLLDLSGTRENRTLTAEVPADLAQYVVPKGFIAINGISLTIANVIGTTFSIAVIPYTYEQTTLRRSKPGDHLNLEVDIMAKYIEKLLSHPA